MSTPTPTPPFLCTCRGLPVCPSWLPPGRGPLRPRNWRRSILDETGVQGGLIVHVGCGDGRLTAALRVNERYLVHGLDTDPANVHAAREHIQAQTQGYGPVSAAQWDGARLPYIDNLANLVVCEQAVPAEEVMRVLAPGGVAYVKQGDTWLMRVKERPKALDEWTHYLHDASNNAVAHDRAVGPPRRMQWVGSPRYSRHHDRMSSNERRGHDRRGACSISSTKPPRPPYSCRRNGRLSRATRSTAPSSGNAQSGIGTTICGL